MITTPDRLAVQTWNGQVLKHLKLFNQDIYCMRAWRCSQTHLTSAGQVYSRLPVCERIWVTDNTKTPVAGPWCLLQAEEGHGRQSRVGLLLLFLRHTIWITDRSRDTNSQCWPHFQLRFLLFMFLNLRIPVTSTSASRPPSPPLHLLLLFLLLFIAVRRVAPVGCRYGEPHLLHLLPLPLWALCILKAHSPLSISHDRASGRATLEGSHMETGYREEHEDEDTLVAFAESDTRDRDQLRKEQLETMSTQWAK